MIAFVDPDLCIGCTQCAGLCPAVFHMEGVLAVAEPGPIPPEEVPQAVDAANAAPRREKEAVLSGLPPVERLLFLLILLCYTIGCEIMEWRTVCYALTGH